MYIIGRFLIYIQGLLTSAPSSRGKQPSHFTLDIKTSYLLLELIDVCEELCNFILLTLIIDPTFLLPN